MKVLRIVSERSALATEQIHTQLDIPQSQSESTFSK